MTNVKPLSEQRLARRKELADVLRSGWYQRDTGKLQSRDGYCCLGVACRVAEAHHVKTTQDHNGTLDGTILADRQPNVERYYGFTKHEQSELAHANDTLGVQCTYKYSWGEIADAIETGKYRS